MAFSKAHLYSNRERRNARIASALGHPARIKIMHQLQSGEQSFQYLFANHPLNKATLSQHLRTLRLAGLIDCVEFGPNTYYSFVYENHPKWVSMILGEMIQFEKLRSAA
ncbi:MAG: ArsR/SmtB family transcription factor [Saprospiraceae bacterium]